MKTLIKPLSAGVMLAAVLVGSIANAQIQTAAEPALPLIAPAPVDSNACMAIKNNFGMGARDARMDNQISALQAYLISKGHLNLPAPSGYFGKMTADAVKKYQKENGIIQTGYVGPLTLEKIKEKCGDTAQRLPSGVVLTAYTNKSSYKQGEDITIYLTARNISSETRVLDFTSCQTHYTIGEYNSQAATLCMMALTSETLRPNAKKRWVMKHEAAQYELAPGTHTITAVLNGYGSATTTVIIKGEAKPAESPVTIVSPNGGETARVGTTIDIAWKTPNVTYIQAPRYDISLLPELPACATATTGPVCRIKLVVYPVATSTIGSAGLSSYAWNVGTLADGNQLPKGKYKVQICTVGGGACDESDDYFQVK